MAEQDLGTQLLELVGGADGVLFGVPGGQTLPLYAASAQSQARHVVVRDERNAATAADAFARVTGTVGICDATVGPGATNLVSGLAEAQASSIPILAIVADTRRDAQHLRRHSVASQSYSQTQSLEPVTKWVGHVLTADSLADVVNHALRVATTGRPGPVVVSIPEDVFLGEPGSSRTTPALPADRRFPRFRPFPDPSGIEAIAGMIRSAARPLLLVGGGVTLTGAAAAVSALAERHGLPVATSLNGKGAVDERSPWSVGVTGGFGQPRANVAVRSADIVVAVGTKLGQLGTHGWRLPAADQALVHVDIDGEEIGRTMPAQVGIVADARSFFESLDAALGDWTAADPSWTEAIARPDESPAQANPIDPALVVMHLNEMMEPDDLLVCEASLSSGWAARYFQTKRPGPSMIAPRGIGGLGWAPGASLGARLGRPSGRVVALTGDGGFGYALGEIETAVRYGLDITTVVLNNSTFGWIRHVEDAQKMPRSSDLGLVDFAAMAHAFGATGTSVTEPSDVGAALESALATAGPSVVNITTSPELSPVVRYGVVRTSPYL